MLQFEPITLRHKPLFDKALRYNNIPSCDYSFATIYSWRQHYRSTVAAACGGLLLRFVDTDGLPCYAPPMGCTDDAAAINLLIDDARDRGDVFRIGAATRQLFAHLEEQLGHCLHLELSRDNAEYIYDRTALASLSGRHLQPKRNFVNRFVRQYPHYRTEAINNNNTDCCMQIYNTWLSRMTDRVPQTSTEAELADEQTSMTVALEHFDELQLQGIVLYADEQPAAFAFGEMLTADTFLTHAEKALVEFDGAYAMINKLTATEVAVNARFINREEDMGNAGLRKSKLSYYPALLLEKGNIYLKDEYIHLPNSHRNG